MRLFTFAAAAGLLASSLPLCSAGTNITVAMVSNNNAPWIYTTTFQGQLLWSGIIVDILSYISSAAAQPCVNNNDPLCGLSFQLQLFDSWDLAMASFLNGTTQLMPSLPVTPDLYKTQDKNGRKLAFTGAWSQSDLAFVTIRDRTQKGLLYLLTPLSFAGWMATLGGFVLAAISMTLFSKCRPTKPAGSREAEQEKEEELSLRDAIFRSSLALTGLATVPPSKHSQRLVHLSAFLLFFFVLRTYLARLTALAAVSTYTIPVNSWEVLTSQPAGTKVGIVAGSAAESWIRGSRAPEIQAVWPYLQQYPNQDAAIAALRRDDIPAMVSESCTARFLALAPPCTFAQRIVPVIDSTTNIGDVAMGFLADPVTYKPSSISAYALSAINIGITRLIETGQFTYIENSYVQSPGNCDSLDSEATIEANPITPQDLSGAMALFGISVGVTFLLVIGERRKASKLKVNGGTRDQGSVYVVGPLSFLWELLQSVAECFGCGCGVGSNRRSSTSYNAAADDAGYRGLASPTAIATASSPSSSTLAVPAYRDAVASLTRGNSLRAAGLLPASSSSDDGAIGGR